MTKPQPQADASEAASRPHKRMRLRWWYLYLPLMLVSFLVQIDTDGPDAVPPGYHTLSLPPYESQGPVAQRTILRRDQETKHPPDIELAYQTLGPEDGPPVILLHGSPGDGANFNTPVEDRNNTPHPSMARRIADAGYRVIIPDLPGFGYSTPYIPDYSNRAHARYLLGLMEGLHLEHAHLVGFSMGGGVALQAYDLAPQRVDSITLFAAIGVQAGEGSGDYHFEHLKYAVGYGGLVALPEFIPHFGFLGERAGRHAFIRNFWDTDQRPNADILTRFDKPMLIVHGESDPLVPAWAAYEHHRLAQRSELVLYGDADFPDEASPIIQHAMIFTHESTTLATDPILSFLQRVDRATPGNPYTPATTIDRAGKHPKDQLRLPGNLEIRRTMSPWGKIGVIILGTFILEDPTSIAVGLFIKAGQIDLFLGAFAVLTGIFLGDLGLYALGFVFGRRALRWKPIARWVPTRQVDALGAWFDRQGWKAVLASRFIPGSRLPLYIAAGVTGNKPGRFMLWTFLAVCIWVPAILLSVILLGNAAKSPFQTLLDRGGWIAFVGVVLVLMVTMNTLLMLLSGVGRRKLAIRFQKMRHHEFWPAWLFYLPLVPYLVWLALRYRSTTVWTLADPCIPDGGVVGESKSDLLAKIQDPSLLPHMRIPAHPDPAARITQVENLVAGDPRFKYPVILKPDAAQRGVGVSKIKGPAELATYFAQNPGEAQLQRYHPGPYEAGIFYIRMPDEDTGYIFSITDKTFPIITGDGKSTLEELIWQHPRYRCQHDTFHLRFADELQRILEPGEILRLAEAGNHAQGTLFRDGRRFITPELTARIDALCQKIDGYYFGRIDVRYRDEEHLRRGEGLAVIELNGVTSESTNLYDPEWSIFCAHRTLRAQWALCFAIGDINRKRGLRPKSLARLLLDVLRYYRGRHVERVSD